MTTNVNATSSKNESQLVKTEESADKGFRLPETSTLQQAAKISIVEINPFYLITGPTPSSKKVLIGVKENQEKLLVKDAEQYTSPISKIYKTHRIYNHNRELHLYSRCHHKHQTYFRLNVYLTPPRVFLK
jgi:hypothetical protein